jgi:penicillin-insensitive murein endopeptidase
VVLFFALACATVTPSRPTAPARSSDAAAEGPSASEQPELEASPPEDSGSDESSDESEGPDDGTDEGEAQPAAGEARPHPLDHVSDADIARSVALNLRSLGAMSVGTPSAGMLVNGREAKKSELYAPVATSTAWATDETLDYLDAALLKVHAQIPGTPTLALGDISAEHGGPLSPHVSHQAGRDVDISYFYRDEQRWYRRGNAENLDLARNWAFVRALVTETDVELLLIDHSIQLLLRQYAVENGENRAWVDSLFDGGGGRLPLIRHARGHATHMHIRFYNPLAQETARRSYSALVARGVVPPVQSFLQHVVKKGETLGKIAKKYNVSVEAIKRANRLKKSLIRERHTYLIPVQHARPAPPSKRFAFPRRRLPPQANRFSEGHATAIPRAPLDAP